MEGSNLENLVQKPTPEKQDNLDVEKFETEAKSYEKTLTKALVHGTTTDNDLLVQNSMDMIEEVGVAKYLTQLDKEKVIDKEGQDGKTENPFQLQALIKDVSGKLAEGNLKEEVRIGKRLNHLYDKWGNVKRAIEQVNFEKKEQKRGRPIISSIQCQGLVERIIKDPKDIVRAIPNRY